MSFLDDIDGLVCDLDGVVYRGNAPIAGAVSRLQDLERRGFPVVYCTNNSSLTPESYVRKLTSMGLQPTVERVVTSAIVAKEILIQRELGGRSAYVVGGDGVHTAVRQAGLRIVDRSAREAEVLVLGIDRSLDYEMLNNASRVARAGAIFLATNGDATYPAEDGLDPGAGTMLAAVQAASGRMGEVLGKPHKPMMEVAAARFPSGARLAMVGDRPDTDLAGAYSMGWRAILVLSGVTDAEGAAALDPQPDLVLKDLGELPVSD